MATLKQMQDRIKALVSDFETVSNAVLDSNMPEIIELNKDQLLGGKTRDEDNIQPDYTNDPYFKSEKHAKAYRIWKKKLESSGMTPTSKSYTRSFNSPNLYITGQFHSGIYGKAMGRYILFGATGFGASFDNKWPRIFGLTPKHIKVIAPKLTADYVREIKSKLKI